MRIHRGTLSVALKSRIVRIFSTAIFLYGMVVASVAFGQANLGRISGSIMDSSGAAVVCAKVTVTDANRGISRALVADGAGEYSAPNLLPGTYTIRAEFAGFQVVERTNILLEVGKDIRVDLTLPLGEESQTVDVTASAPVVDTTGLPSSSAF